MQNLKKALSAKKLPKLILLYGDEDFLKEYYFEKIVDYALVTIPFNKLIINGSNYSIAHIREFMDTYPVMESRKLLIMRDSGILQKPSAEQKEFWETIKLVDYIQVVFVENQIDKRQKKLYNKFNKEGLVSQFIYQSEGLLIQWVERQFTANNKKISKKDISYLLSICPPGMNGIKQEIDKLVNYCYSSVTKKDIDLVVAKTLEGKIFDFVNALISGNGETAFEILSELKILKESPIKILVIISNQLEKLFLIKVFSKNGMIDKNASSQIGISPFLINRLLPLSNGKSYKQLSSLIHSCANYDGMIKKSAIDGYAAIELLICQGLN